MSSSPLSIEASLSVLTPCFSVLGSIGAVDKSNPVPSHPPSIMSPVFLSKIFLQVTGFFCIFSTFRLPKHTSQSTPRHPLNRFFSFMPRQSSSLDFCTLPLPPHFEQLPVAP